MHLESSIQILCQIQERMASKLRLLPVSPIPFNETVIKLLQDVRKQQWFNKLKDDNSFVYSSIFQEYWLCCSVGSRVVRKLFKYSKYYLEKASQFVEDDVF